MVLNGSSIQSVYDIPTVPPLTIHRNDPSFRCTLVRKGYIEIMNVLGISAYSPAVPQPHISPAWPLSCIRGEVHAEDVYLPKLPRALSTISRKFVYASASSPSTW